MLKINNLIFLNPKYKKINLSVEFKYESKIYNNITGVDVR